MKSHFATAQELIQLQHSMIDEAVASGELITKEFWDKLEILKNQVSESLKLGREQNDKWYKRSA